MCGGGKYTKEDAKTVTIQILNVVRFVIYLVVVIKKSVILNRSHGKKIVRLIIY